MGIFSYLIRRSSREHRSKPRPGKSFPVKKPSKGRNGSSATRPPIVKKNAVPIVRTLSAEGGLVQQIIGASLPGAKKMQFPFENIPPVTVNVSLEKDTQNVLLGLGGLIGGSLVASAILKNRKR